MQALTTEMILRMLLYPSALLGALASLWLIVRPLMRRSTDRANAEARVLAAQQMSAQQIAERLGRRR
jgi:flagellar biosynthesis/type III secretory pathway M-ring protein FliF/YscJ